MGLLINELTTNAIKHGFKDSRKGIIHIELNSKLKSRNEFLFRDNGIGFKSNKQSNDTNFGLQLLENLTEQLDGNLERKSNADGTLYKLTF